MTKKCIFPALSILLISGFSACASAADDSDKDKAADALSGTAKLGFLYSKASDTSSSLNSGLNLKYKPDEFSHEFKASTYYTNSSDDDDGVNKYALSYKFSYDLDPINALFIDNEYQHTQYQTYRHTYSVTAGLEHKIIDTKATQLSIGGGPGYRYTKRQADDSSYPNQEENDIIANGFIQGASKITDNLSVGGDANVDYGESNTTYTLGANVTNKLVNNIALVLDTQYIYNTDVSSDDSHDEIYSSVNLTYGF
ncbi:DUF481 domain-containing protein [Vibrio sp.]|nr:DUF481 domain-containing protein [Vibrio sp.]